MLDFGERWCDGLKADKVLRWCRSPDKPLTLNISVSESCRWCSVNIKSFSTWAGRPTLWTKRNSVLEERSSQLVRCLTSCRKESSKKEIAQAWTGHEHMTLAMAVQRSTNWAIKPTGSWPYGQFVINLWSGVLVFGGARKCGSTRVGGQERKQKWTPDTITAWVVCRPLFAYAMLSCVITVMFFFFNVSQLGFFRKWTQLGRRLFSKF